MREIRSFTRFAMGNEGFRYAGFADLSFGGIFIYFLSFQ
jgi:hypothetical protein